MGAASSYAPVPPSPHSLQLSPCLPAFYAYASIFVREFRVRFIGAVAKPGAPEAALTVGLSTPGTSIVRSGGPQLTLFPYVMTPRQSDFFYYLSEDPCACAVGPGPFFGGGSIGAQACTHTRRGCGG